MLRTCPGYKNQTARTCSPGKARQAPPPGKECSARRQRYPGLRLMPYPGDKKPDGTNL
ncbi:hypothetical protein TUM17559_05260 [Enterobacter cloacae]|nr:putative regulatory protein phosphatase [Klebsiella oxytoca]GJK42383.1 hypothetical protein TUM17559_05260 [Enterobacter cloacae]